MKVLITGASGMLGNDMLHACEAAGFEVVTTDRDQLDITDADRVQRFFEEYRPDVVINCAAYNFVDQIEDPASYEIAYAVNAMGPGHLAQSAKSIGARYVHFSTDYVFAGEKPEGYTEEDVPQPLSKYGETKLAGEQKVQEADGEYYICRLSKIFGAPGKTEGSKESFVALMLRLAQSKPELSVVDEEVGCPSYTVDIAEEVIRMLQDQAPSGLYHLVNAGPGVTWYEFAREIFHLTGVDIPVHPVPSSAFPKPAQRPKFAALLNTKRPPLRSRTEALKAFLRESGLLT
jgi:dTDP-4-dehydrorhamnose reductase